MDKKTIESISYISPDSFNSMNKKINEILDLHSNDGKIGLLNGKLGTAFLFFYYSRFFESSGHYNKGVVLIEEIINEININTPHTFCSGIAGIAWGLLHLLENNFIDADMDHLLNEIDPYLYDTMIKDLNIGNWDFLHGASGVCLYFIKRHKHKDMSKYIHHYLIQMDRLKEKSENGSIKWESLISIKDGNPFRGYNICLSHGMASLAIIFSKIYVQRIDTDFVEKLLKGTIQYILDQQLDGNKADAYFPLHSLETSRGNVASRLAWCYGDLGVAASLFIAGNATKNETLISKAIEIFLFSLKNKTHAVCGIRDAGFCHGTSGVASIYKRMYYQTNLDEFNIAANYWFNETLNFANYDDGIAGFKAWKREEDGGPKNEYSLLEGSTGIGLSLLSAISDNPLNWDECLLLY